ncbi:maleate cis-trans isomerase family protein [Streptomyces caatingaensis]|uniref:Arylmalonate decarboxylase n=1 Tax=Streptomyces caatingaensis TaxID=1678637 RepID=A0A0K9XM22_9ACTN|nr:arylmalonate decarboxylase [Streptomyces caatingaensis]KNB53737.1 arylmalonate decarboxylase [Streptomyces caatingaensis]
MTDSLGPRLKVGVVVPATNTSMQPELEALRPVGVTNHTGRMLTADYSLVEGIDTLVDGYRESTRRAIETIVPCKPDTIVIGFSPEIYWDGPESHAPVLNSLKEAAGGLPVVMSPDAFDAALTLHRARRVAVITPYLAVGDDSVSRFFTDSGYDVVRVQGLGCSSPEKISHVSEAELRDAVREIDGPDVDAIVQVGTNVAMGRVAAAAEEWLGKPVVTNNTVLYWHALRQNGIPDRVRGFGSLLAEH